MKLTPVSNHIILQAKTKESKTLSGIIIPETVNQERPEQAKILAVGPGALSKDGTRMEMEVKVGQTVLFKKYAPEEVEIDGEEYLIIKSDDVIAIVN